MGDGVAVGEGVGDGVGVGEGGEVGDGVGCSVGIRVGVGVLCGATGASVCCVVGRVVAVGDGVAEGGVVEDGAALAVAVAGTGVGASEVGVPDRLDAGTGADSPSLVTNKVIRTATITTRMRAMPLK